MARTRLDEADGLTGVPVVDGEERLVGIVAVTHDLQAFCGTGNDRRGG